MRSSYFSSSAVTATLVDGPSRTSCIEKIKIDPSVPADIKNLLSAEIANLATSP